MAGILTSPKTNLQIKNRNAIERRKHLSPNFKEMLRQVLCNHDFLNK